MAAVLTILFALAALVAFSAGARKKKPGGRLATVVCGLAAVVFFILWLGSTACDIIAVAAGVAAVVVYFTGARPQKTWGRPALMGCVAIAVVAVLGGRTQCSRGPGEQGVASGEIRQEAVLIGKALAGQLQEGARVLIIRAPYGAEMTPTPDGARRPEGGPPSAARDLENAWKKGLKKGLGVSVEVVGSETSLSFVTDAGHLDPAVFSGILDKYQTPGLDAWVSLVGVPGVAGGTSALSEVSSYQWKKPPLVAADLGLAYDPAVVQRYVESGLLQAALVRTSRETAEQKVITKENLSQWRQGSPGGSPPSSPPGAGQ